MDRHRPRVVAARLARRDDLVSPALVVPEHARVQVAERPLHRARQRREVDEVGCALLARVPEHVGEDQPSLRVGVRDLDRLAVARGEDVARAERTAADRVLGRADDAERAQGQAEVGDRADPLDHGRAAGHVALHVLHVLAGLERDAARVERDRLADEPEDEVALRVRRVVAEDDQTGRVVAPLRDARERAHAHRADLVEVGDLGRQRVEAGRELLGAFPQPLGSEVVRRAVREVSGSIGPLRNALRALRQLSRLVGAVEEQQALDLLRRGLARLPLALVVAAQDDAVDDGAGLLCEVDGQRLVEPPGERGAEP